MKLSLFTHIILLCFFSLSCASQKENNEITEQETVSGNMIIRDCFLGVETTVDTVSTYLVFDSGMRGKLFLDFNMIDRLFKPGEFIGTRCNYDRPILIDGKSTGHKSIRSMIPLYFRDENSDFKIAGPYFDGVISPDYDTDHRIWEINFEKRQMSIHDSDTVPPESVVFPLRLESDVLYVSIPMKIIKGDKAISFNRECILDYGCYSSMAFREKKSEEVEFIKDNTGLIREDIINRNVQEYLILADRIEMPDGLSPVESKNEDILLFHIPFKLYSESRGDRPLLGLGILRHYNAMIDLKNMRLILWNYDYEKYGKENHVSNIRTHYNNMGFRLKNNVVNVIFENMNGIKAGLQLDDKVQRINGVDIAALSPDALDSIVNLAPVGKEIELDILRDKKPLTIKYTTDRNPIYE